MKSSTFRGLMIVSLSLLLAAVAADAMLRPAATGSLASSLTDAARFGAVFSVTWITLFTLGFIGMFRLQSWGRLLSLASAVLVPIASIVQSLLFGDPVAPAAASISTALGSLGDMTWGAVLALAYFSQVSNRFGANNSFKPMPLRGSA